MENTEDLKSLITAFRGYRDLLSPIQTNLHELVEIYDSIGEDMTRLGETLNGDSKTKLDQIYNTLSSQAQKSTDLASKIDQFVKSSNKYTTEVDKLYDSFNQIEQRINSVNELEEKAKIQIQKLEALIEEKKINYNIKDLQRVLDNYNNNVQKVSDFINKDVGQVLSENTKKIDSIKKDSEEFSKKLETEHNSIDALVETYKTTNSLLSKVVEKNDVNEEYLFEILDNWAISRKIKIKK